MRWKIFDCLKFDHWLSKCSKNNEKCIGGIITRVLTAGSAGPAGTGADTGACAATGAVCAGAPIPVCAGVASPAPLLVADSACFALRGPALLGVSRTLDFLAADIFSFLVGKYPLLNEICTIQYALLSISYTPTWCYLTPVFDISIQCYPTLLSYDNNNNNTAQ